MSSYEQLKADAANLIGTLCNTIDGLEDEMSDYRRSAEDWMQSHDRVKAEGDELWHRLKLSQDELAQLRLEHRDVAPRIIAADELEAGMWAAWHHNGKWWVEVIEEGYSYSCIDGPFVLLADAPPKEPEPKRLTVEDLDAAEVGSVLESSLGSRFAQKFTKEGNGSWRGDLNHSTYTAAHLTSIDYLVSTATLTPPEKPERRGRVVKRGELRDGDVIDFWASRGGALKDIYIPKGSEWADNAPWPGEELRLVSRKPPEPSEHEAIRAFRFYQAVPIEGGSPLLWEPVGEEYVGRYGPVSPEDILDWSPARVVPAGQEG